MSIPQRALGKTGIEVTALGLGGACWNLVDDDQEAVAVVHRAIDRGITYLDTVEQVEENVRVAESFVPLGVEEERALLARALELVPGIHRELWWLPEERIAS